MKRTFAVASLIAALALTAVAEDMPAVIKASDKAALDAADGKEATVEGKVALAKWSRTGTVCAVTFEDANGFSCAVFKKNKEKLDAGFGGDFAKQLTGATVKITGKIAAYGGRDPKLEGGKQIIIGDTGQVTIVTPAATQPATAPTTP